MANAYTEYFANQLKYSQIHGKLSIFFTQCGMFFESYETLEDGYDLQILSSILNISLTRKDKSIPISNKNPYMLGFPCAVATKYIKILVESGYTVIIEEQVSPAPKPKRAVTGIYSPSTFLNEISKPDSNYMLTIYLEEFEIFKTKKRGWGVGLSLVEPSIGYVKLHECYSNSHDNKISLDEVVKFINIFSPSEILIITDNVSNTNETISYLELKTRSYLHKTLKELQSLKGYANIQQLGFQTDLFKKIYKTSGDPLHILNLDKLTYGRNAFAISLMYLLDHNLNLLNNISKPEIYIKEDSMHLGNNPISQLDIFIKEDSSYYSPETSYKCLFDIINRTLTPMGKRNLKSQLSEPLVDSHKLNLSYEIINHIKTNCIDTFDHILSEIKDLERLTRKICICSIHPFEFSQWFKYIQFSLQLLKIIKLDKYLTKLLDDYFGFSVSQVFGDITNLIEYNNITFKQQELDKYCVNEITGTIFSTGKYKSIDDLQESIDICTHFMNGLANYFNTLIKKLLPKSKSDDLMVKVDTNERDGYFLIMSTKRSELLKSELKKSKIINITLGNKSIGIHTSSIRFVEKGKGTSTKIFCDELKEKSDSINDYIDQIKVVLKETFVQELSYIDKTFGESIYLVSKIIAQFDFLLSGAKCAQKFFYSKPIIKDSYNTKSYFIANQLRHPIAERINSDTEYIPISTELGTGQDGILLFGVNAAGKSTLQKSIGMAIIMAQIGYFVPATEFIYYPYKSIITRIKSSDNIFKGLSTFGLELVELGAILKRNSSNTLIIADELCSGTEHISSLVIVMTMIAMLAETNTSFITATHLHELNKFSRLDTLTNVKKYHLHMENDPKTGKLIYDRNLREGSGCDFYGMLLAQHMISDYKFTSLTNEFLNEYSGMALSSDKKSRYNSKVFVQSCSICGKIPKPGEIPLETHHINPQADTNEFGQINSKSYIHKNHKSNLVVLCSICHDLIDTNAIEIFGWHDTNKGRELNYTISNIPKTKLTKSLKDLLLIDLELTKKIKNTLALVSIRE